jgi:hypothetical protein
VSASVEHRVGGVNPIVTQRLTRRTLIPWPIDI